METGDPSTIAIAETMAPKAPLWDALVSQYGLRSYPLDQLVNWAYLDMALGNDADQVSSLTKIVSAGWTGFRDTPATITCQLQKLRDNRIIP